MRSIDKTRRWAGPAAVLVGMLAFGSSCAGRNKPALLSEPPAVADEAPSDKTRPSKPRDSEASAPRPSPRLPPVPGEIGAAGPIFLLAAAPDAHWVAYCQARADTDQDGAVKVGLDAHGRLSGDRLEVFWRNQDAAEERLERFLDADPSGRWVLIQREGRLLVVDTVDGEVLDLTARGVDGREDAGPAQGHRAVRFDPTGARVAYLRRGTNAFSIVLIDLVTSAQSVIDLEPGEAHRLEFDASGAWLIVGLIPGDTNRNGKLDWPVGAADPDAPACLGPLPRYPAWVGAGDRVVSHVARIGRDAAARAVPDLVAPLGRELIVRDDEGRLHLSGDGPRLLLADKACNARLVHRAPGRGLAVVACLGDEDAPLRPPVSLVGRGYRKHLGFDMAPLSTDWQSASDERLVPFYPRRDSVLLDLLERKVVTLEPQDAVLHRVDRCALVRRGDELFWVDVDQGTEGRLAQGLETFAQVLTRDHLAYVSPYVIDLAASRLTGTLFSPETKPSTRPTALALSRTGELLVAPSLGVLEGAHAATLVDMLKVGGAHAARASPDETGIRVPLGPLRWLLPATPPESLGGNQVCLSSHATSRSTIERKAESVR